jgi:hypothetical protein
MGHAPSPAISERARARFIWKCSIFGVLETEAEKEAWVKRNFENKLKKKGTGQQQLAHVDLIVKVWALQINNIKERGWVGEPYMSDLNVMK